MPFLKEDLQVLTKDILRVQFILSPVSNEICDICNGFESGQLSVHKIKYNEQELNLCWQCYQDT